MSTAVATTPFQNFFSGAFQANPVLQDEWEATDLKFISRICRSMPLRLQLLLENNGHKISY